MKSDTNDNGNIQMSILNCIIHQEIFCKKSLLNFDRVMTVLAKSINFIRSKVLDHRQVSQFLNDVETELEDIIYYIEMRLMSCGKCFNDPFFIKNKVQKLMSPKANQFFFLR